MTPTHSAFAMITKKWRKKNQEHLEHELGCTALCCAHSGQCAVVSHLNCGADEAARLRDLGVREGAIVTVVRDGDPLMIGIDDARFGIGRSAATKIFCRVVE